MKSFYSLLFFIFIFNAQAQSFYKGALVIDANAGIEIYNTKVTWTDITNNKSETDEDRAGNLNFHFGAEYGLHKNFGVGLRYKSNNYFVEKDTVNNTKGNVRSNDIIVQANYHPVSTKYFDLILGGDFGYSAIHYKFNDKENTQLRGSGLFYSFYLNPRLYIGPFGFNMKVYAPFISYPNLISNDADYNKNYDLKLKGTPGFGMSLGIQYRFLKAK